METSSTTIRLLQFVIAVTVLVPRPQASPAAGVRINDPWDGINRNILRRTGFESRITNPAYSTGAESAGLPGQNEVYSFSTTREQENVGGRVDAPHGLSTVHTTIVKCSRAGYLENPINCGKFYNCIKFGTDYQPFSLNCVGGTIFYPPLSKCVNPESISPRMRPICATDLGLISKMHAAGTATTTDRPSTHFLRERETEDADPVAVAVAGSFDAGEPAEDFLADVPAPRSDTDDYSNSLDDGHADADAIAITQNDIDIFVPVDSSPKNYSYNSRTSRFNLEEFDYSNTADADEPIGINLLDSIADLQSGDFHDIELPNMRNRLRPPETNRTPNPKVWFGFRSKDPGSNVVNSIGNPFKDDETTLAVILDFATSRLQIYSKNKPPR